MTLPNETRGVISRRALLEGAAAACAASIAAPFINRGRYRLFAWAATEYSARAISLMQRSVVIDMLCPLTLNFPQGDKWFASPETFTDKDFQKWRDSGITVMHPAVGLGGVNAYESGLTFFAQWNSFIAGTEQYFDRIDSPGDFKRIKGTGKVGVILGLQNSSISAGRMT
jgi:membrane dipeptidase